MRLCGISSRFQLLSPCIRQVAHALLTRPPLNLRKSIRVLQFSSPVRLACVKHAASVHPEPGSNSLIKFVRVQENPWLSLSSFFTVCLLSQFSKKFFWNFRGWLFHCSVIKVLLFCSLSRERTSISYHQAPLLSRGFFAFLKKIFLPDLKQAEKEGFEPSRRY